MAANFQPHMGVPGQMMPQQQQRPQQQRQNQAGQHVSAQINQVIFQTVTNQTGQIDPKSWQSQVLIQERISLIFNIIANLRLASATQPNPPGLNKMMEIGIKFEKEIFDKSMDKAAYKRAVDAKLEQLLERRNQNQAGLQQTINQQAQAQAHAQQAQAQQMMMNPNGMQGQPSRLMQGQPSQQGFSHLQHQMQASPLPGQQPSQVPMGMANDQLPPNMTQNQQQQFQMSMQQQQPQQQQNPVDRPQNGQPQLTPQDQAMIMELANRLMSQAPQDEKNAIRQNMRARMDPQQLNQYTMRGQDPLLIYYRQQALIRLRSEKQSRMAQAQAQAQQFAISQQAQNMPNAVPGMQRARSINPSPLNGHTQPPTSMGGNNDFGGFMGNMESLAVQQQQEGFIAQGAGQVVVPASGAQANATPQLGVGMPGQPMGMGDQRGVGNPNNRAQQQQQMLNAQQRMHAAAQQQQQQQSQAQARMNAQAKTQMGLQGQPGGMGNGPLPPQQSPALPTLNAPLKTTSQMGHPEGPQINPNQQFGQPLDPRFVPGNQRQIGPANGMNLSGVNPAMFAGMSQEQQQRMAALPPEKLSELLTKWNEQRAMNQAQGGRPPMPMPGNQQIHPGQQVPQPGQFNPQNPMLQFQRQQAMSPNMTPQQQLALQQQIARLQQQGAAQPRVPPQAMQIEQRMAMQMDSMDIPPNLHNHASFPRGVPPEIKKWGLLKQWVQQNPSLGPEVLDSLKALQRYHYQSLLRARATQQAGQQPGAMQPGAPGGPGPMSAIPPGMSAPVAPMGPNAAPVPAGMNMPGPGQIRQPTQAEIQNARQHHSGRMANATDDQIRSFLMRQMAAQRQQQHAQMMQNMQMANPMAQLNGQQQPRPGQPPQNMGPRAPNQPVPPQPPQPKKPPGGADAANSTTNAANANRTARPVPTARSAQNPSAPQPAKNLKRASSDDVVEVPNPALQQPSRPAVQQPQAQQGQGQKPPPQQGRLSLTPAQVATLDPEARKKYEADARMAQAAQANQRTVADLEKLKTINQEELAKINMQPPADIPLDAEMKAKVTKMLREILQPFSNMTKAIPRWYGITHDDNRARMFFRFKNRLAKQFRDPAMTQPKDTFSISTKEIEQGRNMLNGMVKDLSDRFPGLKKSDPTGAQAAPASQPTVPATQAVPAPTVPLNAANLQEQQQQLNKLHQRSNSRGSHAPAAPTSAQPPFPFSAKSPPDGVPAYIGKSTVTQENLHLPARKKQKQNNNAPVPAQGTPGSNASPQVSKGVAPEVKRQPAEAKPQPRTALCCSEPECDRHNVGFDSEEALRIHTQEEHIKPLEDPFQYAQQNLASTLGLDARGQSKKPPVVSQDVAATPTAPKMATSVSRQGHTPNVKGGSTPAAATPMNRQVSMNRQGSAAGAKSATPAKATPSKDGSARPTTDQKDASKQQAQPPQEMIIEDPWANATIDPHDLFQAFQTFESGAGGAISDMNVYRSITPNDTPESSKDGVSEPNSDISDGVGLDINLDIFEGSWMPFGPSETDTLFDMNSINFTKEDDVMMLEEQPSLNFKWDDMIDPAALDKPFSFDTSLYSMNAD
ncbi:uncharacterized protein BP5553_00534 [Venustampulla echinocandica]|uniref:Mediator complex subunit 15 KIX domain-containing protein n=1 Tax=Venustampulla echinocandica TaxID=2656787 RepID=A0A370TYF2_9HELO|nr:uncharacterized protein BP5553_00534 [Venustampulla echinocandica]RDL40555.1 hypothetical protein BP5553_00534 [Venustampulla echinocandica]